MLHHPYIKTDNPTEKASRLVFVSLWFTYLFICFAKINYNASIAYIVAEKIFSKTSAGSISSIFYLLYGIGQIAGGRLIDRISPYKAFSIGLIGAMAGNLLLCFINSFWGVMIVWGLCGLAQFSSWPSVSRVISKVLIDEHKKKASTYMCICLDFAGILSFGLATHILRAVGWSGIFAINTSLLVIAYIWWRIVQHKTENILVPDKTTLLPTTDTKVVDKKKVKFLPIFFASGLFLGVLMSMLQTMLNNGAKNWIPTMIMEVYNISDITANMQTVYIYIANAFGVVFLARCFNKIKNEYVATLIADSVALVFFILIMFIGNVPAWVITFCLIMTTTMMSSLGPVKLRVANKLADYGCVATVSGITNALASFGIVVASFLYGYISELYNNTWTCVTVTWVILIVINILICIPTIFMWKKFLNSPKKD